jgi:hypothetical protein
VHWRRWDACERGRGAAHGGRCPGVPARAGCGVAAACRAGRGAGGGGGLARLLGLPGASELHEAWLAALAGEHGYLDGLDAEVAACDAMVTPVVTGHPDLAVVDQMIDIIAGHLDGAGDRATALSPEALSPQARQALRHAIARLAVDLVAGPDRLASILRRGLLDAPGNSKPVILDVGVSAAIPGALRRAVQLRARHCEWPAAASRPPTVMSIICATRPTAARHP